MTNNLLNIKQHGQKIWLDNLSRDIINSGILDTLIREDGIAGITSNPTIFYRAISSDSNYQAELAKLKQGTLSPEQRYEQLVIPDIVAACHALLPLYHSSNKEDGYVSFEVSPYLANDTANTIFNAKRLWQHINLPNLMIKIPATVSGLRAFTELTALGINVNITLLFSHKQVLNTWQAYIEGLAIRVQNGKPVEHIKAVASLFLSRIDNAVDDKLPKHLHGQTAINIAKMAYISYQEIFHGEQFKQLELAQAKPQYLLFASTGSKNPNYSDVLYVESLIGPETINTVPEATLAAFRHHGVSHNTLTHNLDAIPSFIHETDSIINLNVLGEQLQQAGLDLFAKSFADLLQLVS